MIGWNEFFRASEVEAVCQDFDAWGLAQREVDGVLVTVKERGETALVMVEGESAITDRDRLAETIRVVVRYARNRKEAAHA